MMPDQGSTGLDQVREVLAQLRDVDLPPEPVEHRLERVTA